MKIAKENDIPLEILVATMNRNSLQFLLDMFKYNDLSKFNILIVNQTSENCLLESNFEYIRVLNVFEKGLSKSRNVAIKNAVGTICLLADDDVVFEEHFYETIIASYDSLPSADLITFKTKTTENKPYSSYPNAVSKLSSFYKKVLSIEITFKKQSIIENNLFFDEHFGLGGLFQDGENRLFLKSVLDNKILKSYFVPEFIVRHEPSSSSDDVASDRFIFARSALNYKQIGFLVYFYIIKLLFSLLRKRLIKTNQIVPKWKVAQQAINTYKSLSNA